jgi:hypothetical protein
MILYFIEEVPFTGGCFSRNFFSLVPAMVFGVSSGTAVPGGT